MTANAIDRLLFDTDILIEYLRDRFPAVEYLEKRTELTFISTITVAELFTGVRTREEEQAIDEFLLTFEVLPVTAEIGKQGGL